MAHDGTDTSELINSETKKYLTEVKNATDEELKYLEKLLKIQKEKTNNERASGRQPSIVVDSFLYHGDLGHAIDIELLLELKISHIINMCDCPLDKAISDMFNVLWIKDLEDNIHGNIRPHFDETNKFLSECKKKNEKVLVHCQAGISRSSSIVLAYLISCDNYSLEKAYEHLLERRPIAAPNHSFLLQLIRYEKEVRGKKNSGHVDNTENTIQPMKDPSIEKSKW